MHQFDQDFQNTRMGQDCATECGPSDRRYPSNSDLLAAINAIGTKLTEVERGMTTNRDAIKRAFVQNDLGEPDLDGHRMAHRKQIEESNRIEAVKSEMTKKFLAWLAVVLGGFLVTGLGSQAKVFLGLGG